MFENMIHRSVPGYDLLLNMIAVLSQKYALPGTRCYDLGCSLGASTLQIRRNVPSDCVVVGVDSSAAMVTRCRQNMMRDHSQANVEILEQDLLQTEITNASVVVMNFTLQFVADTERQQTLCRIAEGLVPGGILILAEKVKLEDTAVNQRMIELHQDFKKLKGYSDLEIAQKRASLEDVLVPNTITEHRQRMFSAGFGTVELFVRCLNFVAFLAIKS